MEFKTASIEAAFTATGRDPKALPIVSHLLPLDQEQTVAKYQLQVVVEAVNQEANGGKRWVPNFNNRTEPKYELWLEVVADEEHPGGVSFSRAAAFYDYSGACAGARLFKTIEAARYTFKQFKELFEKADLPR
jgi:hypothetical protein